MLIESITFLSGVDMYIYLLAALISIIVGIIGIFKFFPPYIKSKKDFSDLFIYRKATELQQYDFGIQQPLNANAEVYKRRGSDDELEESFKQHENVLVIGVPKSGKTRSIYQAIRAVLPDFFVIKVLPKKVEAFRFPILKKNYLVFFDDLNEFTSVNFDLNAFLKKFKKKSKNLIAVSTCRSGDEYNDVKENSMEILRTFPQKVNLDDYELDAREGEALAQEAGVPWKPEQFLGTPGSVILDVEDMKNRYRNSGDSEKSILRACKLLKRANIFIYRKELIREICASIFETSLNESSWMDSITYLKENGLVTKSSIPQIAVYDATLETVVDDYDPSYHLENLLNLLIKLEDAEKLFYLGVAFHDDKNYEKAEKSNKECLRINPDYAEAHYNFGVLLGDLERYEGAEHEYREAIRNNPNFSMAHNNLGSLLYDLKRYEEAEKEYREAIRSDPDHAFAHNNLGLLLSKLKRAEEAEKEYREAIRIHPDYAQAHNNLGNLFDDLKRYEEAEKEYCEAINFKDNLPDRGANPHNNLGVVLYHLKRYEESEKEFQEVIRINSDFANAYYNLGMLYSQTGRLEEAKRELEIAKRLFEEQGKAADVKKTEKLLQALR